jgi:hypothetical protein
VYRWYKIFLHMYQITSQCVYICEDIVETNL